MAAFRGIISTVRMFFIIDDYGTLTSTPEGYWLLNNVWVQILFWSCHIFALIGVQAVLISIFGRKAMDFFRIRFGSHTNVYIINSGDKNALILGENIATNDGKLKQYDSKRLVVILPGEDDDVKNIYEKAAHFGGIVQVLDKKHKLVYYLDKAGLGKRNQRKKYSVILMSDSTSIIEEAEFIANYSKEKDINGEILDVYSLTSTDWDMENIEKLTYKYEDYSERSKYPYTPHIVSRADLLIRQMVQANPPFKCPRLNFNSKGEATNDFSVMILGFGNIGQRALLRLIMNGQFVGSQMRAYVMDKDIERLNYCFKNRYPEIEQCCEIIPSANTDIPCKDFYELLNGVETIDYIVIALGDDQLNRQIAIDIRREYLYMDRDLPYIAVCERNSLLQNQKTDEKIFSFGCREEIYKYSVILREESDYIAKAVNTVYEKLYGGKSWYELDWIMQESNRASADHIDVMLGLANVSEEDMRRKIAQLEDDEHKDLVTLTDDKELAENLSKTEHLRWNAFHAAMGFRRISIEEMISRFNNYNGESNPLDYCRRDTEMRLHVCLASWDDLDKISEAYRELAKKAGIPKNEDFNFKNNDRDIVINIPKFIHAAKKTIS